MLLNILKPSFAAGELSPSMYGRTDIAKYDVGAALLQNFIVLRYGGISNRPGTKFMGKTAGSKKAILLDFRYNTEQNIIIEVTAGKFRFYTSNGVINNDDGQPYEVENDFKESELPLIKKTQSADVLFLVHPDHHPMTLTRYSNNNWKYEKMDITGGPFSTDYNNSDITVKASELTGDITITASKDIFTADDVGRLFAFTNYVDSVYKKGIPKKDDSTLSVDVLPGSSCYVESFGFWDGNFTIEKYSEEDEKWVKVRSQNGNRSQNYNFTENNDEDKIVKYRVTSTEFNTDTWSGENEKQRGYVTIQSFGNDYMGYAEITEFTDAKTVKATVKRQLASLEDTKDYAFGVWGKKQGYPSCIGFFEDRLIMAGSKSESQTYWTSKTGDYYNFGTSIPTVDDDAITATLNGWQMNGIRGIVPFAELILLTAGGEYKVTGNGKPITPSNVISQPQEYRGINDVAPVTVGSRIIYIQEQGNIIRDLAYSYDVDKYTGQELNLLAQHLFDGHKIISMAYQQIPNSIVWCVRDDGLLLGLTYLKEQDVYAWHQHSTENGKFINVCTISGPQEDELWAVVLRGSEYFVEKMERRNTSTDPADQYFVDCGVSYDGEPIKELAGLEHLEGQQVAILADGNVQLMQTVTDGKIVLRKSFSKIHVGLPITAKLQTLPIEFNGQDGSWQGKYKRIPQMTVLFQNSRGGVFGINESRLDEIKWRSTEKWGKAISLFTGKQKVILNQASWDDTVKINIEQHDPLPITILSIVPSVEPGG